MNQNAETFLLQWPYPKRATAFHQKDEHMDEATQAWHESFKPTFTSEGTLLYAQSSMSTPQSADWQDERLLAGEGRDLIESSLKGASKQDVRLPLSRRNSQMLTALSRTLIQPRTGGKM